MQVERYLELKRRIIELGYERDVTWAENVGPCADAADFALEAVFVICNSGMRAQIARPIFNRVWAALNDGTPLDQVFGHVGKCGAIRFIFDNRKRLFKEYQAADDKVSYLASLPWIGGITKYHLAKNFGVDCCKPDRHLVRIAASYSLTPDEMCRRLAVETGDRIGTVDIVIWRSANLRLL